MTYKKGDILENRHNLADTHLVLEVFTEKESIPAFAKKIIYPFPSLNQFLTQANLPIYFIKDLSNYKVFFVSAGTKEYFQYMDVLP